MEDKSICIRLDGLDDDVIKRLDKEASKKNRSEFIRQCIEKCVHDEHILNKISELENEILDIKNILLKTNLNNSPKAQNKEIKNESKNKDVDKKSVHDEHNLKLLEEDLLSAFKF